MAGIAYTIQSAENYGRPIVTGLEYVTAPTVAADSKPLPKPQRVEKWQRWSDRYGTEHVVADVSDIRAVVKDAKGNLDGVPPGGMRHYWTFLGYAKPDKVEAGQRWRTVIREYVVANVRRGTVELNSFDGASAVYLPVMSGSLLTSDVWEYLGMAESVQDDWRIAAGEALDREAKRNGFERSIGDTDEKLRARFVAPIDPKLEARRANEEAAKRLIANPPEWAYPKAWMCAVLAAQEYCDRGSRWPLALAVEDKARGFMAVCRLAHDRKPQHVDAVEADRAAYNAYARGMERPTPLLTRQGVRGISTVDMGEYYE